MRPGDGGVTGALRGLYLDTLRECAPSRLVSGRLAGLDLPPGPLDVLAVGKCAEELARGVIESRGVRRGLLLIPRGYARLAGLPAGVRRVEGTHPQVSEASVGAALAAREFLAAADGPVLALVSGGSSACVEAPLEPWFTLADVVHVNRELVRSGLDIEAINTVRKHLSAVKGGRLGALLPPGSAALVLSDVDRGRIDLVGSGLVFPDTSSNADAARLLEGLGDELCLHAAAVLRGGGVPETVKRLAVQAALVADNGTLVDCACRLARERGWRPVAVAEEVVGDVQDAAGLLAARARQLAPGEVLVGGGEPTVKVRGPGRGGRCSELAVRFARLAGGELAGLFGSSDGVDGASPAAAVLACRGPAEGPAGAEEEIERALARSASYDVIGHIGEPIFMEPTGNNLRDLFLVVRHEPRSRGSQGP